MKKTLLAIAILGYMGLLSADDKVLMVFGDSLSTDYGFAQQRGWVSLLHKRLEQQQYKVKLVNASISGDTTQSGLTRLPQALVLHKPTVVILELGGNDGLRGLSVDQLYTNLVGMIELLQKQQVKILLVGIKLPPNYGPTYTQAFERTYTKLAQKYTLPFLPFLLSSVAGDKKLTQDDGLHPNENAQATVLDNVWQHLTPLLTPI